jgi:co-chaperonin GroES (HSP10)
MVKPALNNPVTRSGAKIPLYPTGDRVVVERLDVEEEAIGGLIIPGGDKDKNLYCTVIAAGPLAMDVLTDMAISIGDTVAIGKYSGVHWDWRPKGTLRSESVDVINVKDIFGGVELVDKIMDGRLGIEARDEDGGRHRFMVEVGPKEAA